MGLQSFFIKAERIGKIQKRPTKTMTHASGTLPGGFLETLELPDAKTGE